MLLETAGLPQQRFHDLRHATASLLLAEGVDLFTVKEILGHSQISLTANTYGHLTDKLADDAAARLDRVFSYAKTDQSAPKRAPDPIDSGSTEQDAD
jgi:integrase